MPDILELTANLGKAISQSAQAQTLHAARQAVEAQPEVAQLLKDFQAQNEKLTRLQREKKPIEPEDKRKLEELHGKLVAADLFKKFMTAQVEYVDLLRRVNETLRKNLGE